MLYTGGNESPGPGLQRVEGRGLSESATTQSLNLNASIRDRLRSKVRGRQVGNTCIIIYITNLKSVRCLCRV